jgi:tetratricopeptide (TPR) repeat protein
VLVAAIERAAGAGLDLHAWQLAWTLAEFLDRRGRWDDWVATQTLAQRAARRLDRPAQEAEAHRGIGTAYTRLDRHDEAHAHFLAALDLFGELGDDDAQVNVHFDLCGVFEGQGRYREALSHARQVVDRYRTTGNQRGIAQALNAIGWHHAQLGEYRQSIASSRQALSLLRKLDDRHGQAESWDTLGYAHHLIGEQRQAASCYRRALELCREAGDRYGEACALAHLGDIHLAVGDPAAARGAWQPALKILDELGHPEAEEVREKLKFLTVPDDRTDVPA